MMFSKFSILVAVTLAAFATAAGPLPQQQGGNNPQQGGTNVATDPQTNKQDNNVKSMYCSSGHLKCCTDKHMATADEAKLANNKMGSNIKAEVDPVWVGCIDFDASQGKTCPGLTVCCDNIASDGSFALGCTAPKEA